jgi:hypothetical protein
MKYLKADGTQEEIYHIILAGHRKLKLLLWEIDGGAQVHWEKSERTTVKKWRMEILADSSEDRDADGVPWLQ